MNDVEPPESATVDDGRSNTPPLVWKAL